MARRRSREQQVVDFESLASMRIRTYIRESTQRQAEADHYGPDLQRAGIRTFCDKYDIPRPEHEYFDAASGRSVRGRTGLQKALADADEYDALFFFHSSRSFRNREDVAIWKPKFRRAGIVIVFTEQGIISGDPRNKLLEGFHELIDEQRSDEQAMFIRSGLRQKFERGLHNGTVPLGYRRYHGTPDDSRHMMLEAVDGEARTVQRLFELYSTGRYSDADVAAALNAQVGDDGNALHRMKNGRPLTRAGVGEILQNRVYTGAVVWHPGTPEEEVRDGQHEAITDSELFEKVQALRARRTHWRGRRSAVRCYPLSRPARCYDCGASFAGDTGGKANHRRLRHARTGECRGGRSLSASVLEDQMGDLLEERFALPKDWERQVLRIVAAPQNGSSDGTNRDAERLAKALEALRKQHKWGDISDGDYRIEREELERRLRETEERAFEPVPLKDFSQASKLLANLGELWRHPGVSRERQKAFIEEAFEQIQLDATGIRAVVPQEEYRLLAAVAQVGGIGRGDWI